MAGVSRVRTEHADTLGTRLADEPEIQTSINFLIVERPLTIILKS